MTLRKPDIKPFLPSVLLTLPCLWFFFTAQMMAVSSAVRVNALVFHFFHANIFHLLCNLLALYPFKPRLSTAAVAYLTSTLSAFILSYLIPSYGPVCGLSAIVFACFARRYAMWHKKVWKIILFNVPFIFIPQVDGLLHLLSFFTSYLLWRAVAIYRERHP